MNDQDRLAFTLRYERDLRLLERAPWFGLRLEILDSLWTALEFSDVPGKDFQSELIDYTTWCFREALKHEISFLGVNPLQIEKLLGRARVDIQEHLGVQHRLTTVYCRLNAYRELYRLWNSHGWIDGEGITPDRVPLEVLLSRFQESIPPPIVEVVDFELSRDRFRASASHLNALFMVQAGEHAAGQMATLGLENVIQSTRFEVDQVRIATHLVDEHDALGQQALDLFHLLRNRKLLAPEKHIRLFFTLDQPSSILTGNSIGLPMVLLSLAALENYGRNPLFEHRFYEDVAFTGAVSPEGLSVAIDRNAITHKVRTGFFCGLESIVIPEDHVPVASAELERLKTTHGFGEMTIRSFQGIEELQSDRSLIIVQRRGVLERADQFVKENRFGLLITLFISLMIFVGGFWFGVVRHPVPVDFDIAPTHLTIKNRYDYTLWQIEEPVVIAKLVDLSGDGRREVLIGFHSSATPELAGRLACYSRTGKLQWSLPSAYPVDFGKNHYENTFKPIDLVTADFNRDGRKETVCLAFGGYFPTRIFTVNADGQLLAEYWHSGGLESGFLNYDSTRIIYPGRNQESRQGILLVLDPLIMKGSSPQQDAHYRMDGATPGNEILYLRFPRTHWHGMGYSDFSILLSRTLEGGFRLANNHLLTIPSLPEQYVGIVYVFGPDLNLISASYADNYLAAHHQASALMDNIEPLSSLDPTRLEWWSGEAWVSQP